MVLHLRPRMEHIRYGRNLPSLSTPLERNAVPFMRPVVGAFRLVHMQS